MESARRPANHVEVSAIIFDFNENYHMHVAIFSITFNFILLKIETCVNSNCGAGKRCIMKKGLPKCVCAPTCSKAANNSKKAKIAVVQMPDARNLKRNEKRPTPAEMQNDEPTLIVANVNQRQGTKRTNQRTDKKNKENANEALIYSPLINAHDDHQVQMYQPMDSNMSRTVTDDHANMIETKIRSGFFNDNTVKVTSYADEFYIGNQVKFVISYTKNINSRPFYPKQTAEVFTLQPNLRLRWQDLQKRMPIEETSVSTREQDARC